MQLRQVTAVMLAVTALAVAVIGPGGAAAAPPAQGTLSFDDAGPASGALDSATPQVGYSFQCFEDGVGSVVVTTTAGDLAVEVSVLDPTGRMFASGREVSSSPTITAAEAFVMPSGGQCTVNVARSGATSGSYEIRLLPGYAGLDVWDTFDGDTSDPLQLTWDYYQSESMEVEAVNGQLRMDLTTDNLLGYAEPSGKNLIWSDYYIQADFTIVGTPSYYEYGFVMRLAQDEELFYSLTCSSDGDWSFYYFDGEWQAIQDWTVSPVIDGMEKNPRLGILLDGSTFTLFFDNQLVAEVTDPMAYAAEGTISLAAATGIDQLDPLTVLFDNLVVTEPLDKPATLPFGGLGTPEATPTEAGLMGMFGATKPPTEATPTTAPPTATMAPPTPVPPTNTPESPFPMALRNWSGSQSDIVGELVQLGVVPAGG